MGKKFLTLLMGLSLVIGLFSNVSTGNAKGVYVWLSEGQVMLKKDDYTLATGVIESQIVTNSENGGQRIRSYAVEIEMSKNVKILANYGKYYGSTNPDKWYIKSWSRSRTTSQAARYMEATGNRVLVAINGDFFNMANGKPKGALVINGEVYHDASDRPFFAILKNGTAAIYDAGSDIPDNCMQAVGGAYLLVNNGAVTTEAFRARTERMPSTAIGIRADGSVVMYEVDGRDEPYSVGITLYEQAQILIGMGCVKALFLDAGGSATYASTHRDSDILTLRNDPSDGGERAVASTLMVVLENGSQEKESDSGKTEFGKTETNDTASQTTKKSSSTAKTTTQATTQANNKTAQESSGKTVKTSSDKKSTKKSTKKSSKKSTKKSKSKKKLVKVKRGNHYYTITDRKKRTAEFSGVVNKSSTKIIMFDKIEYKGKKYKVTTISQNAFKNCKKIKNVKVGKYIKDRTTLKKYKKTIKFI